MRNYYVMLSNYLENNIKTLKYYFVIYRELVTFTYTCESVSFFVRFLENCLRGLWIAENEGKNSMDTEKFKNLKFKWSERSKKRFLWESSSLTYPICLKSLSFRFIEYFLFDHFSLLSSLPLSSISNYNFSRTRGNVISFNLK